jgi:hypothetical protein
MSPKAKNELWEYDLTTGAVRKSSPQESGCEDYYNSVALQGGGRDDDTIEKAFHPIENDLPKLFKATRNKQPMTDNLWSIFFAFIAIQHARCPSTVSSIHNFECEIHQAVFEMLCKGSPDFQKGLVGLGVEPHKALDEFEMQASQGSGLLLSLQTVQDIVKIFRAMKWIFLCASLGKYFLTSDKPVCNWVPPKERKIYSGGFTDAKTRITFPLTKEICAFGTRGASTRPLYNPMTADNVDLINFRTIMNSRQFVYGPVMDTNVKAVVEKIAHSQNLSKIKKHD